jgi:hypothetical protein
MFSNGDSVQKIRSLDENIFFSNGVSVQKICSLDENICSQTVLASIFPSELGEVITAIRLLMSHASSTDISISFEQVE